MTCHDVARLEESYLGGALDEAGARAFEAHLAACATCELRLQARTRRDLGAFAPALPPSLRADTLAAVRRRRSQTSARRWWITGAAAAAVIAAAVLRMPGEETDRAAVTANAVADSAPPAAVAVATRSSSGEFAALDAALRELEAAIAAAPEDRELRQFLASVLARREELERRVKDAS